MKCLSNREIMNLLEDDKARLEFSSNEYIICKTSDSKILRVNKFIKEYGYKPLELEVHY